MIGLEPVNRHHNLQIGHRGPRWLERSKGTGDQLHEDTLLQQSRDDSLDLAIPDEGISPDERGMQRPQLGDQGQDALDEFIAAQVVELSQCECPAQVRVLVRVTSGTAERALPSD